LENEQHGPACLIFEIAEPVRERREENRRKEKVKRT
jgi:hypothetical protein